MRVLENGCGADPAGGGANSAALPRLRADHVRHLREPPAASGDRTGPPVRRRVPGGGQGVAAHRPARHRQDPRRGCGAQAGGVGEARPRPLLRHPEPARRDSEHLRPGDPDIGGRRAPPGGRGRAAGARRPRRGAADGLGGRDHELHRQHPVQRSPPHHLHVELRGPSRPGGGRLAPRARRLPHALPAPRDVRVPGVRWARLPRLRVRAQQRGPRPRLEGEAPAQASGPDVVAGPGPPEDRQGRSGLVGGARGG